MLWPEVQAIRNKRQRLRHAKALKRSGFRRYHNPKAEPLTLAKLIEIKKRLFSE